MHADSRGLDAFPEGSKGQLTRQGVERSESLHSKLTQLTQGGHGAISALTRSSIVSGIRHSSRQGTIPSPDHGDCRTRERLVGELPLVRAKSSENRGASDITDIGTSSPEQGTGGAIHGKYLQHSLLIWQGSQILQSLSTHLLIITEEGTLEVSVHELKCRQAAKDSGGHQRAASADTVSRQSLIGCHRVREHLEHQIGQRAHALEPHGASKLR